VFGGATVSVSLQQGLASRFSVKFEFSGLGGRWMINEVGPYVGRIRTDQLAVVRPGYRLWCLVLVLHIAGTHLAERLITVLELAPSVPSGRLIVIARTHRLEWTGLAELPGVARYLWLRGPLARDIVDQEVELGHHRGPLVNVVVPPVPSFINDDGSLASRAVRRPEV
jgi:hypothetical protein